MKLIESLQELSIGNTKCDAVDDDDDDAGVMIPMQATQKGPRPSYMYV